MPYVDGFLIPVPNARKDAYFDMARKAAPIFKEMGATRVVECWGDDVMKGKHTDFFMATKAEADENIVFSWIEYPDRATRDKANEGIQNHEAFADMGDMPFDGKRMIFSGFVPIVDTDAD